MAIIGIILCTALLQACLASSLAFLRAGVEAVIIPTYPSANEDITSSTVQWKDLEVELMQRIDNIESEFPDYDEYIYDIDPMEHDPYELMAYLSAMHLSFTHPQVSSEITELFELQNELELITIEETRYDTEYDDDGEPYEVEYIWYILLVKLKPKPFTDIILPRLANADATEMYELYMDSGGNRQLFGNPFPDDWRSRITSHYGNRKNPTGPGYEFHYGIDLAYPGGTPIHSVQNGVVVTATYHALYGNYIVISDKDNNRSLYSHCSAMYVSVGDVIRKGEIIAAVGSTGNSTGNHLHLEIKVRDERVNPLFYIGYGEI